MTSYVFLFRPLQESVTSEWDLYHDYTTSQVGLHDLLRDWRAEMDAFSREPGRYRYVRNMVIIEIIIKTFL